MHPQASHDLGMNSHKARELDLLLKIRGGSGTESMQLQLYSFFFMPSMKMINVVHLVAIYRGILTLLLFRTHKTLVNL